MNPDNNVPEQHWQLVLQRRKATLEAPFTSAPGNRFYLRHASKRSCLYAGLRSLGQTAGRESMFLAQSLAFALQQELQHLRST